MTFILETPIIEMQNIDKAFGGQISVTRPDQRLARFSIQGHAGIFADILEDLVPNGGKEPGVAGLAIAKCTDDPFDQLGRVTQHRNDRNGKSALRERR